MNGSAKKEKNKLVNGSLDYYDNSVTSRETDDTYLESLQGTSITMNGYTDICGLSIGSNGGSSQVSLINGHSSASSQSTVNVMDDEDYLLHYSEIPGVLAIGDATTNLIFQGKIGSVSVLPSY